MSKQPPTGSAHDQACALLNDGTVVEIVTRSAGGGQAFVRQWRGPGSAHAAWVPVERLRFVGSREEVERRAKAEGSRRRGGLER